MSILTHTPILTLLDSKFVPKSAIRLLDSAYETPTFDWVQKEFAEAFRKNLGATGSWAYSKDRNDCNTFALHAWSLARMAHANTSSRKAGLAFGFFTFQQASGFGHALNTFIYRDAGQLYLGFFEPQKQECVNPSDEDIAFCDNFWM